MAATLQTIRQELEDVFLKQLKETHQFQPSQIAVLWRFGLELLNSAQDAAQYVAHAARCSPTAVLARHREMVSPPFLKMMWLT